MLAGTPCTTARRRPHKRHDHRPHLAPWRGSAQDAQALAQDFWRKLGRVAARLPFAADLLAAYYCAFDRETPLRVKAMLLGAIAYFVLPGDAIPDVLPVSALPMTPRCSPPRSSWWPTTSRPITTKRRGRRLTG